MNYNTARRWETLILGTLAEEGNFPGQRPIFVNTTGELQFSIQIISTPPSSFPKDQQLVTCYGSDLEKHGFEDNVYDPKARIQKCLDFLENKLLAFEVEQNRNYFIARNIKIMAQKPSYTAGLGYSPIPLYRGEKEDSLDLFLMNLKEGQYIGQNEQVSHEPEDTPRYLIYETVEGNYFAVGEFDHHHYAHGGFSFSKEEPPLLAYFSIDQEIIKEVYISSEVAFVEVEEEHSILTKLQSDEAKSIQNIPEKGPIEESVEVPVEDVQKEGKVEKAVVAVPEVTKEVAATIALPEKLTADFMGQFIEEVDKMQLVYKEADLYNFHASVKTGGIAILTGLNGIGKTKLITAYQKAFHQSLGQFLAVRVNPVWTDPSHVFGYVDLKNYVYRPSATGIVELLIEAEQHPEKTFVICFDDLNVAKVDHYLSLLFTAFEDEDEYRTLTLYHKEFQPKIYNGDRYPAEIKIGSNVLFTGTASTDENTHPFSNKVLDHANVITLHIEPFSKHLTFEGKMTLTEVELAFLWEVHRMLTSISAQFGISPRVVQKIDRYIQQVSAVDAYPINRKQALDLQFAQKIIPKLRGSEQLLQSIYGVYDEDKQAVHQSSLITLFDQYGSLSAFEKSRTLIVEKSKELVRNGYTF